MGRRFPQRGTESEKYGMAGTSLLSDADIRGKVEHVDCLLVVDKGDGVPVIVVGLVFPELAASAVLQLPLVPDRGCRTFHDTAGDV
jgi:hypothetical protein